MAKLRVIKNIEIDSELLKEIVKFDRSLFPITDEYSFPDGYLENMYKTYQDGIFALLNEDKIVGYVNCIFLTDEIKEKYLKTKDYLILENNGFQEGNNNMYFYTIAIDEKYRHTKATKILMESFAKWLYEEKQKGKNISSCISEAITIDGIKSLKKMGMVAEDVDENGLGIYNSPDCLNEYIETMLRK